MAASMNRLQPLRTYSLFWSSRNTKRAGAATTILIGWSGPQACPFTKKREASTVWAVAKQDNNTAARGNNQARIIMRFSVLWTISYDTPAVRSPSECEHWEYDSDVFTEDPTRTLV